MEITSPLKEQIQGLLSKSNDSFNMINYIDSKFYLTEAWNKIPGNKYNYDDSYLIAWLLIDLNLLIKDYADAKGWSEILFKCDLERVDSGDREFMAARVAFEAGDLINAKEYFKIAFEKSEGRCFEGEDKKYLKFFRGK